MTPWLHWNILITILRMNRGSIARKRRTLVWMTQLITHPKTMNQFPILHHRCRHQITSDTELRIPRATPVRLVLPLQLDNRAPWHRLALQFCLQLLRHQSPLTMKDLSRSTVR